MYPSDGQEGESDGLRVGARRPIRDDKGLDQVPGRGPRGGQGALRNCLTVT